MIQGTRKNMQSVSNRDRDFAVSKRSRGRSGCLNCRRRRKKCDETKPSCTKCNARGESCEWDTKITFRLSGIETYDPSLIQSKNLKPQYNEFQITDIVFDDDCRRSQQDSRALGREASSARKDSASSAEQNVWTSQSAYENLSNRRLFSPSSSAVNRPVDRTGGVTNSNADDVLKHSIDSTFRGYTSGEEAGKSRIGSDLDSHSQVNEYEVDNERYQRSVSGAESSRHPNDATEFPSNLGSLAGLAVNPTLSEMEQQQNVSSLSQLDVLNYLTDLPNNIDWFSSLELDGEGTLPTSRYDWNTLPKQMSGNAPGLETQRETLQMASTCSPNTMNEQLQTRLYYHMVETARHTALTRHASPEPEISQPVPTEHESFPTSTPIDDFRSKGKETGLQSHLLKAIKLTRDRQIDLWQNYIDEVAVWLDMFDNDRNFQFQIPLLAKSSDHLHYSILALSARQMERKRGSKSYAESIGLYQEAIQLIVKDLYTLDTAVIASCVLLCVLEMMSSSSGAWCRHLDGCAMLLKAAGINGVVGGVRQALFWCFARMDVWGGFVEDTITKIPTSRWFIPSGTMMEAVEHFKSGPGSHSYANYAVFLCASAVNVISNRNNFVGDGSSTHTSSPKTAFAARWRALFDLLEDWISNRPEEMQPLMAYPPSADNSRKPFPALLYGSSPAINGNQLYHAATLLMLQHKPKSIQLQKPSKSILWHARQICGIALSNSDHGALINSLQPLWIAGRLMSHSSEHRAILSILSHIEKEIGWATAWRAEDLKEYWGDVEETETY